MYFNYKDPLTVIVKTFTYFNGFKNHSWIIKIKPKVNYKAS